MLSILGCIQIGQHSNFSVYMCTHWMTLFCRWQWRVVSKIPKWRVGCVGVGGCYSRPRNSQVTHYNL